MAVRWRSWLLGFAVLRTALGLVAAVLAAWLYDDHLLVLVLLRPTKEVLLLAGYEMREHGANPLWLVLATLPLLVGGVWGFFALGKAYAAALEKAEPPGIAGRLLPRQRIVQLRDAVAERGWLIVFLGRLAVMPSTLVAAAAGSADMPTRTFLLADLGGALCSLAMLLAAGFFLGRAYEEAGPWFTGVGALVLVGLLVLLGQRLRGTSRPTDAASRSKAASAASRA